MNAACALLLLFVEEAEAVADDADAAQLRSREREVRGLHAAIATRGKRNGEREGGLLELHLRAPHGPLRHSLTPCLCLLLPLPAPELPLPLQPFSWGLRLQELGQGGHTGALGAHFNFHPQNHYK